MAVILVQYSCFSVITIVENTVMLVITVTHLLLDLSSLLLGIIPFRVLMIIKL